MKKIQKLIVLRPWKEITLVKSHLTLRFAKCIIVMR